MRYNICTLKISRALKQSAEYLFIYFPRQTQFTESYVCKSLSHAKEDTQMCHYRDKIRSPEWSLVKNWQHFLQTSKQGFIYIIQTRKKRANTRTVCEIGFCSCLHISTGTCFSLPPSRGSKLTASCKTKDPRNK